MSYTGSVALVTYLWQGDVGLPGLMGLPGEKGETGSLGNRGRRVSFFAVHKMTITLLRDTDVLQILLHVCTFQHSILYALSPHVNL